MYRLKQSIIDLFENGDGDKDGSTIFQVSFIIY